MLTNVPKSYFLLTKILKKRSEMKEGVKLLRKERRRKNSEEK